MGAFAHTPIPDCVFGIDSSAARWARAVVGSLIEPIVRLLQIGNEGLRPAILGLFEEGSKRLLDISVIALWLSHETPVTTHQYVQADLVMNELALAKLHEPETSLQRYRAPDTMIDFLKTLRLWQCPSVL